MKLSKRTLTILKNFGAQNINFYSKGGTQIMTNNVAKTVFAVANIEEDLPEFGIYNINDFIGAVELFSDPDLDFQEKCCVISEGKQRVTFHYADASYLVFPKKVPTVVDPNAKFYIESTTFSKVVKAVGTLKAPDCIIRDGELVLTDSKTPQKDSFIIDSPEITNIGSQLVVNTTYFGKLLSGDYACEVKLMGKGGVLSMVSSTPSGAMIDYILACDVISE